MNRKIFYLFISVLFSFSTAGCSGKDDEVTEEIQLKIDEHVFMVEIADTPGERQRGYMERENIGPDKGMLFVFPDDRKLSFWMKNTPTPLSIAYIDSRGVIREIHDMEPLSEKTVPSRHSVRYALEVVQGRFDELGIEPGDRLIFTGEFPSSRE